MLRKSRTGRNARATNRGFPSANEVGRCRFDGETDPFFGVVQFRPIWGNRDERERE
jgi:hypothetical protein